MGWNIGANDTANCVGTALGAGLLSFRRAVLLVALFSILGALCQGQYVMKTIGQGIVRSELDLYAVLVALIFSGVLVTLATIFRIPASTSQAIVGGMVGVGLSLGADIDSTTVVTIAASWLVSPLVVMALAFALSHLLRFILNQIRVGSILIQNALGWMTIFSSCYVAYAMGANNAGNASGPIANLGLVAPRLLLLLAGAAIALGALSFGKKVAETVGKGLSPLDIPGAFVAQFSAAIVLHLFSLLGVPVSTSSAAMGAVVGVGLVRGARAFSRKTALAALLGWALVPCLAALGAFLVCKGVGLALR